jgi:hypothetical protein
MRFGAALLMLALAGPTLADIDSIPTNEEAFLSVIGSVDQENLIELLGDPAEVMILRNQENGEVVGAIVHYRYINTNNEGEYYKTTELDYLDGRLVTVLFSNSDIQETTTAAIEPVDGECPASC